MRKAALRADQVAVLATPVDTGRARANWIASTGQPVSEAPEGSQSGSTKEARGANAAAKALQQAQKIVQEYTLSQGSIFLSNNVEYIVPLDQGSSRQAPAGMSAAATAAATDVFRRARLLRK